MTACLFERAPHVDRHDDAREVVADRATGATRKCAPDPVLLMPLLRVSADSGFLLAPMILLLGLYAALRRELGGGRDASE